MVSADESLEKIVYKTRIAFIRDDWREFQISLDEMKGNGGADKIFSYFCKVVSYFVLPVSFPMAYARSFEDLRYSKKRNGFVEISLF